MIDHETGTADDALRRAIRLSLDAVMEIASASGGLERLRRLEQHVDEAREVRRQLEEAAELLDDAARYVRAGIAGLG